VPRLWDGVEGADSLVVNPHKWLVSRWTAPPTSCATAVPRRVMSTNPSYLQTAADGR
jgi:aromatic-L-amino-acid decarboxylase